LSRAASWRFGRRAALDEPDDAILAAVAGELREIAGVQARPRFTRIARWPRSMAQYTVATPSASRNRIHAAAIPGLHLAGNAYTGIGIPIASAWARRRRSHPQISGLKPVFLPPRARGVITIVPMKLRILLPALLVALSAVPAARADLTVRYKVTFKPGEGMPASAVAPWKGPETVAHRDSDQIHGDVARSQTMTGTALVDYAAAKSHFWTSRESALPPGPGRFLRLAGPFRAAIPPGAAKRCAI